MPHNQGHKGQITELFGDLSNMVMQGVTTQQLMNIIVGDAEEPDVGDLGYDIAMEGQGMSFFDQILAETGNVPAAIAAAKEQVMQGVLAGQGAEDLNIERIKINEAAKAAIETKAAAELAMEQHGSTTLWTEGTRAYQLDETSIGDIGGLYAETYGVNSTDVVKAINLQQEEIESENAKWAFDPGQMQTQLGMLPPSSYNPNASPASYTLPFADPESKILTNILLNQNQEELLAFMRGEEDADNTEEIVDLLATAMPSDTSTDVDDLLTVMRGEEDAEDEEGPPAVTMTKDMLAWIDQTVNYRLAPGNFLAPSDINETGWGSGLDETTLAAIMAEVQSRIDAATNVYSYDADDFSLGAFINDNKHVTDYVNRAILQMKRTGAFDDPVISTDPGSLYFGNPAPWWDALNDQMKEDLSSYIENMSEVKGAGQGSDDAVGAVPTVDTTFSSLFAEATPITPNMKEIRSNVLPVSSEEISDLGIFNIFFDTKNDLAYAQNARDNTWFSLGPASLTGYDPNADQPTGRLTIGGEGSNLKFTLTGKIFTRDIDPTQQAGAIGRGAVGGGIGGVMSPMDIATTFGGDPSGLWEAARVQQLGRKANVPQYWEKRMQGFNDAYGRYMLGSQNETFYNYLTRSAQESPEVAANDWGLAVDVSRNIGSSIITSDPSQVSRGIALSGYMTESGAKKNLLSMAMAGMGMDTDSYSGISAYNRLSDMYDIFEQQAKGVGDSGGRFLAYINDQMSGQSTGSREWLDVQARTADAEKAIGSDVALATTPGTTTGSGTDTVLQ